MAQNDSTRPIDPAERGAVARFLETCRTALVDPRVPDAKVPILFGVLVHLLDRAATDVRRGHRAGDLDTCTFELKKTCEELAEMSAGAGDDDEPAT